MVVTPREAIKLNIESDRTQLAKLETTIDAYLRERFDGDRVYVDVEDVRPKVLDEVKRRYVHAGWKVEYTSNQRDGSYLIFQEAKR